MSDVQPGPLAAAEALYQASGGQISQAALAVMTAIAGRESTWTPSAVQPGGQIGDAYVGVGEWQITPGTSADLDLETNAREAWAKMEGQADPFAPWNIGPSGNTLIDQYGTLPGGAQVQEHLPSADDYAQGQAAAAVVFQSGGSGNVDAIDPKTGKLGQGPAYPWSPGNPTGTKPPADDPNTQGSAEGGIPSVLGLPTSAGAALSDLGLGSVGNDVVKAGLLLVLVGGAVVLAVLGVKSATSSSQTLKSVKASAGDAGEDLALAGAAA